MAIGEPPSDCRGAPVAIVVPNPVPGFASPVPLPPAALPRDDQSISHDYKVSREVDETGLRLKRR
jgi:hypothetical protein